MQTVFHCYNDPGHGWLKVPHSVLHDMNLKLADFSGYSYYSKQALFLEEDCDMPKFLNAYLLVYGRKPVLREHYCNNDSNVRRKYGLWYVLREAELFRAHGYPVY